MSIVGTVTVRFLHTRRRKVIYNVPKSQYNRLSDELMSRTGPQEFQMRSTDGTRTKLDKSQLKSIEFKATGTDS